LTVAETGSQTFAGVISNSGSLTKTAAGTLTLTGANTYSGGTAINGGTLALGSAGALGSSGTIAFGGGTLQHSASNTTDYSARFSTDASQQYSIDTNGQSVTLATALTSTGGTFTKSGTGTLTLSAANTYTGTTTINAGVLALTNGAAIADTGTVTLADVAGATLTVQTSETIGSLQGGGAIGGSVSILSGQTLTVAETGSQTFAGTITGSGGLSKTGIGTLTLTGLNTYSGATTVSAGALQVGSGGLGQTGTGAVTVQTGSTLLGTGLVQGTTVTLADGGTLRPGDSLADSSHGTLTFNPVSPSGDTSLQGDIILGISGATITDTTYGGNLLGSAGYNTWVDTVSGVGTHDRLVFLGSGGHNVSFLTSTGRLEVVGSSFTPQKGQIFNLLDWGNLVTTNNFTGFTFNSGYLTGNGDEGTDLDLPNLDSGVSGLYWDVSRFTASGNIVVVPEPSRVLLLLTGLVAMVPRRRRSMRMPCVARTS
jgi:autotransporter-associated beta strand protein